MTQNKPAPARQRVADLRVGQPVRGVFMAKDKQLARFSSKPGRYLTFTLFDRTGEIKAVAWDEGENIYGSFEEGDIVLVEGSVTSFRRSLQVTIETLKKCRREDYTLSDFLPHTEKDVSALMANLRQVAASLVNSHLRRLLLAFLSSPEFAAAFMEAPAGKAVHHAVIGGLIEHTSNVVSLCESAARLYPAIDRELLIAGAILHDMGKTVEYTYDGPIDMSDEGKLIGHIVIGDHMLSERIAEIDGFPAELALQLRHMILSHHGQLEWGSPKRPKTIEACALHFADNLDASVAQFLQIIKSNADPNARWSAYEARLGRQVYLARTSPLPAGAAEDAGWAADGGEDGA